MTSAGRASIFLGAGTVIQIVSGFALAKILAISTGVNGVGLQGLCLAIGSLAALAGGLGVGAALMRVLGSQGPEVRLRLSTATVTWFRLAGLAAGVLTFGLILVVGMDGFGFGPLPLAQGVPLCLGITCALMQTGDFAVLTAYRASQAIAVSMAVGAISGAGIGAALIYQFGYSAITTAYLATQASAALAVYVMRRRDVGALAFHPSATKDLRPLIANGVTIALSTVVGSGVQLIMPLLILRISGLNSVGLFRAVTAITMGGIGIIGTSLARDYYPRVAAASPQELLDIPRQQQRLLLTACVPLVVIGTLFATLALRLAYSPSFEVASTFFGLQLVGEIMRLISYTYAYVLLARAGRGTYLALETAAGALLLVLGIAGLRFFGLNGLGAAYLITYTAYLVATTELCRRRFGVRPSPGTMGALTITAAAGLMLMADWPPFTQLLIVLVATGASTVLLVRSRPSTRQIVLSTGVS